MAIPGFTYEFVAAGKAVFHIGDRGDKFYLILSGSVGVYVPKSNEAVEKDAGELANNKRPSILDEKSYRAMFKKKDKTVIEDEVRLFGADRPSIYFNEQNVCLFKRIHKFGMFDSFGDMALTTDKPRTASIIAITDLNLLSLTKLEFRVPPYI